MILLYTPEGSSPSLESGAMLAGVPQFTLLEKLAPGTADVTALRGKVSVLVALARPELPAVLHALDPDYALVFGELDLEPHQLAFTGEIRAESYGCPLMQTVRVNVFSRFSVDEAVPEATTGPQSDGGTGWPAGDLETLGTVVTSLDSAVVLVGFAPGSVLPITGRVPALLPEAPIDIPEGSGALAFSGDQLRVLSAPDIYHKLLGYSDAFETPAWSELLAEPAPCLVAALLSHLIASPSSRPSGRDALAV